MLAGPERNGKVALDVAAPRFDAELRARVARDGEPDVAGVRGELVVPRRIDDTLVGDVAARRLRPHDLRRDTAEIDVAARRLHRDSAFDVGQVDAPAERVDRDVAGDRASFDVTGQRRHVQPIHDIVQLDVAALRVDLDLAFGTANRDVARLRTGDDADALRHAHLEAAITVRPIPGELERNRTTRYV